MNRLEHRIERDLRQIAGRATPSPDAWNSILTRISDQGLDDMPVPFTDEEATMIGFETPSPTDERHKRTKRVLVAGLLAAAVVVAIALVATRNRDHATPTDQPSPTVTVAPTTPPQPLPNVPGDPLEPGTYYVDEVSGTPTPRIFATLDSGWTDSATYPIWHIAKGRVPDRLGSMEFFNPVAVYADACHWENGYHPGPVDTVDGLVTALREQQGGWVDVTAPSDISIDGYVGKAFQRTLAADMPDCTPTDSGTTDSDGPVLRSWETADGLSLRYEPGQIETLWVLDLNGTIVVIATRLPVPSAAARADFADDVLDSIRIERA